MQFNLTRQQFNRGLSQVGRLANVKMPLPILGNILIEAKSDRLILSTTDLEIGIEVSLVADIKSEGRFTVPARLLSEFVQASNEQSFNGRVDNATLTLVGEQSNVKIRGLDASEFPTLPFTAAPTTFLIMSSALREAIGLVSYACAIDETRPVLAGIALIGEGQLLTIVATDSYRLAEKQIKLAEPLTTPFSVIVPRRTMLELQRLMADATGDISVFVGDNQIQFSFDETRLVSRLIEGNYPQYQAIIPKEYRTRVTANVTDFIAALKTSQLFAREAGNLITLAVNPGQGLTVKSAANQKGESTNQFTAIAEGDELIIGFNVKFLLDGLAVIDSDNLFLEFSQPDRPLVMRPTNSKEYFSLIMPLRID